MNEDKEQEANSGTGEVSGTGGVSWTVYFSQVSSFIADCERQYGICNQNYCEYAIERLSIIYHGIQETYPIYFVQLVAILSIAYSFHSLQQSCVPPVHAQFFLNY